MADTVSVTALKYHTHAGAEHHDGDVYDVDAVDVDNLIAQGMVKLTDAPPPPPAKPSQPVEPMTTANLGIKPKAKKH